MTLNQNPDSQNYPHYDTCLGINSTVYGTFVALTIQK